MKTFERKMLQRGVMVCTVKADQKRPVFGGYVRDWIKFLSEIGFQDPILTAHAERFWAFQIGVFGPFRGEYDVMFYSYLPIPNPEKENDLKLSPYIDPLKTKVWAITLNDYACYDFENIFKRKFEEYMEELRNETAG